MRVTWIETLRTDEFPNIVHVRVGTDEGVVGLGETSFGPAAAEAFIHESVAPYLLGTDPTEVERHAAALVPYVGFGGASAENRGRSAIDLALWDIVGKLHGRPLHRLLGGPHRERIPAYNTCAGYRYIRRPAGGRGQATSAFGIDGTPEGPYEDLDAFLHRPVELARSLLDMGITAMKIWPFDAYAEASGGHAITASELAAGRRPFELIRDAFGDAMDLMLELHGLWDVPSAIRIGRSLADLDLRWIEDPVRADVPGALARVADAIDTPIAAAEVLGTRSEFDDLITQAGVSIVIFEPVWVGGVTQSRRVIDAADAAHLPVAVHDCLGPVEFATAVHLSMFAPNAFMQESVRAFWDGWYREIATDVPQVVDGIIHASEAPGIGVELRDDFLARPDLLRRCSRLDG